jgi:hypothetical protein
MFLFNSAAGALIPVAISLRNGTYIFNNTVFMNIEAVYGYNGGAIMFTNFTYATVTLENLNFTNIAIFVC